MAKTDPEVWWIAALLLAFAVALSLFTKDISENGISWTVDGVNHTFKPGR